MCLFYFFFFTILFIFLSIFFLFTPTPQPHHPPSYTYFKRTIVFFYRYDDDDDDDEPQYDIDVRAYVIYIYYFFFLLLFWFWFFFLRIYPGIIIFRSVNGIRTSTDSSRTSPTSAFTHIYMYVNICIYISIYIYSDIITIITTRRVVRPSTGIGFGLGGHLPDSVSRFPDVGICRRRIRLSRSSSEHVIRLLEALAATYTSPPPLNRINIQPRKVCSKYFYRNP